MLADSESKKQHLITPKEYLVGLFSISWRLPSIYLIIKKLTKVIRGNRASWGSMLEENTRRSPENPAIKSEEASLTYKEYNESVNRYANYFLSQGLKKGDTVVVFLETRPELVIVYSAIAKIGAINSMINTNLREDSLLHCMNLNPGKFFVIGEEVLEAFEGIKANLDHGDEHRFFFVSDKKEGSAPKDFIDLTTAVEDSSPANPPTTGEVELTDTLAYVFTSGTTGGMPKAAVITHRRVVSAMYFTGKAILNVKGTDTIYVPLPFFHTNALALSWPCVFANGAALAVRRKFSASRFWDDVRKYNATIFCYVGECCRYLMNQPPKSDDAENPLTTIIGNGLRPDIWKDFKKRFAVSRVFEIYGAAESNLFFVNMLNLDCTVGTCATTFAIVKYDIDADEPIRDKNGFLQRVGIGEAGLLLGEISERSPFSGYTNSKATESKILRDVLEKGDAWFNTGDLIRDIGFKHAQFVDRLGDTFRWKGENVSTTEVEKVANAFPHVSISSVYGVVMPGGDGRAGMVAVIPETSIEGFDFRGLADHFRQALPLYAVPKFLRFKTDFEYTPTHKIKKVPLKREGFDPDKISDPLYVLLPEETAYKPLTEKVYEEILKGKYKL